MPSLTESINRLPLITDIRVALDAPRVDCAKCGAPNSALNFAARWCDACCDRDIELAAAAQRAEFARNQFEARRAHSGIPTFAYAKTFATFDVTDDNRHVTRAITRALKFPSVHGGTNGGDSVFSKGVTIIGLPNAHKQWPGTGNGKTHLLYAIANHLIAKGRWPLFTRVDDLLREVTAEWKAKSDYDPLEKYISARVLLLDELTFESAPPSYVSEALNHLVDQRVDTHSRLFVTTNLPVQGAKSLTTFFGNRFVSRLHALTTIEHIHGPDRRLT